MKCRIRIPDIRPDIYHFYKILKIIQFFKHLQQYLRKLIPSLDCKKAGFLKKIRASGFYLAFFKSWPFLAFFKKWSNSCRFKWFWHEWANLYMFFRCVMCHHHKTYKWSRFYKFSVSRVFIEAFYKFIYYRNLQEKHFITSFTIVICKKSCNYFKF